MGRLTDLFLSSYRGQTNGSVYQVIVGRLTDLFLSSYRGQTNGSVSIKLSWAD